MKKLLIVVIFCLSGMVAFAQNAVVQSAPAASPESSFWTSQNLWILAVSAVITGFVLLVMFALSRATSSMANQLEKKKH